MVQVADNPTMLLIDTPGVMLPKLTASTFAYRVALAGLVQEARVPLSDLFAFTLYVLSQSPNKSQLKAVLAEALPKQHGQEGSKPAAGTQATIRRAYASKRFAKCILQAIDEVLEIRSKQDVLTAAEAEPDIWSQHRSSCDPVNDSEAHPGSPQLNQGPSGGGAVRQVEHAAVLQQLSANKRPRLAGEYLAMLQSSSDPRESQGDTLSANPFKCTADANTAGQLPAVAASSSRNIQQLGAPLSGGWVQFEDRVWSACGEILLRKLIKPSRPVPHWEPPPKQAQAAMEKVLRLVRAGHLGKLVFEEPRVKPGKQRSGRHALNSVLAATAPPPTDPVVGVGGNLGVKGD